MRGCIMKNKKKIIIISISTIAIVLMITLAIILNKNTNGDRIIQSTKNPLEEYQENETKVLNLEMITWKMQLIMMNWLEMQMEKLSKIFKKINKK